MVTSSHIKHNIPINCNMVTIIKAFYPLYFNFLGNMVTLSKSIEK